MKVVLNKSSVPFSLSGPAEELYNQLSDQTWDRLVFDRTCKHLVEVVETLGASANGLGCALTIVEVNGNSVIVVVDDQGIEQIQTQEPKAAKNEKVTSTPDQPSI